LSTQSILKDILTKDGALLDGHFVLRSGNHSSKYLQCALLYQHPDDSETVARLQAEALGGVEVDAVVGPATGGIVAAYELARVLGCRSIFAERVDDVFTLRRGFRIEPGEKIVVAEDVITTGGAVQQVVDLVRSLGGEIAAVVSVVNRSGKNPFDAPFHFLYEFDAPTWEPSECPLCRDGVPTDKPGSSRGVKN
jgi:orotate phosphoribosyltransferase